MKTTDVTNGAAGVSAVAAGGRTVAIVGRPNVGKSALFNRLARKRVAIVHSEEGVTRDRLMGTAEWLGEKFKIIDTGGLALMDRAKKGGGDAFQAATAAQVKVAIEDAGAVIQVVDVRAGVQPMDEEVSRLLRAAGKPVVLAANKADEEGLDDDAAEFARLGWETHAISAAHGRGVEGLVAAVLKLLKEK